MDRENKTDAAARLEAEGWTASQIAERLGTTPGTIRVQSEVHGVRV
jgi:DNA-binding NarL/FixJ family response regulator